MKNMKDIKLHTRSLMKLVFLIGLTNNCISTKDIISSNICSKYLPNQSEQKEIIDTVTWQSIIPFPVDSLVVLGVHYPEQDAKLHYGIDKGLRSAIICYKNGACIHRETFEVFVEEGCVSSLSPRIFWSENDSDYEITTFPQDLIEIHSFDHARFCTIRPVSIQVF